MIKKIISKKSGLNKTFVINVISTIILQGFAIITMPVFSRILGSEQYGYYAIFNSWTSIFASFISLSISAGIGAGSYKYKEEYVDFRNNMFLYTITLSILNILICIALYPFFTFLFNFKFDIFILVLLTAFSSTIISTVNNILIYEKRAIVKLFLSVSLSVANFIVSLLFIYLLKPQQLYLGKVYGHFLVFFLASLVLIFYFLFNKKFYISTKYFKFCILYGLPLVLHTLSGNILSQSDRVMMQKLGISMANVGIYSIFFTFSSVMNTILSAFNTSYVPFYYDFIDKNDKKTMIEKSINYSELFTVLSIGFLLLSREVSKVMVTQEFYLGIELIPIFVSSVFFNFLYHFPANFEFFYGKTIYVSIGTILAAIVNIILNYYFIIKFGIFGAAIATSISSLFLYIFHYIIAYKIDKLRFYMKIEYFIPWILLYFLFIWLFYLLKDYALYRWLIGGFIGIIECVRIIKRKRIF